MSVPERSGRGSSDVSRGRFQWLMTAMAFAGLALLTSVAPDVGSRPTARVVLTPAGFRAQAHAAAAQQCGDPYPAARNPSNPLDLPAAPLAAGA